MKNFNLIGLVSAFGFGLLAACTSDSLPAESEAEGIPAEITGSIGTATVVETKAAIENISYGSFVAGDNIGFFSTTGLEAENVELTYTGHSFKRADSEEALLWKEGVAEKVYAYYPYSMAPAPVTGPKYPVSIWRTAETDKWNDGFQDFLAASADKVPNGSLISLSFSHQFAMLMIKRGQGFDTNASDIQVRLNYKVAKQAYIYRQNGNTTLRLQVDETAGEDGLVAYRGTYTPAGSTGSGVDCAYVIIPVGDIYKEDTKQGKALTVASVVLENNAGAEMTVPFTLSSGSFKADTKYLVTVKMRDNRAVIEPEEIRRWDDESIHVTEPAGIKTAEDFETWLSTYNDPSASERMSILSRYGTYDGTAGKWTFLLLNDIRNATTLANSAITGFTDNFDGQGHTISHISLGGNVFAGFFGTLSGEVKNLKLHDIRVAKTDASAAGNFGALAGTVTGTGKISNCHITGDASFVVGAGNTGGIAGLLQSGGSITDCTSTAVVRGADSATTGLLVGKDEGGTVTGCSSTGTLITNN